ncbi:hypothetical protein ElyMa_002480600 [Elysia marginata]|uniref:MARVEL domain-containing protein n=1 Tax=Elysia marginata TaxID=1093978 RepID=A0AAV4GQ15_9GAST|nr:hypothetical protein ElyMa_002480600 [Elysia marginata]
MPSIPQTHLSSKLLLVFSCVSFLLYSIAIPQPYWLRFRATVPANPPDTPVPERVKVHIGLFRACKNVKAQVPEGTLIIEDWCKSKHAPTWHEASAGFGVVAMVSALAQLTLCITSVTVKKVANRVEFKLASVGCSSLAVGFMIPILVLFDVNRDNYRGVHYDLFYCYVVAIIGMVFYFFLALLTLIEIYFHSVRGDPSEERLWVEDKSEETPSRYT